VAQWRQGPSPIHDTVWRSSPSCHSNRLISKWKWIVFECRHGCRDRSAAEQRARSIYRSQDCPRRVPGLVAGLQHQSRRDYYPHKSLLRPHRRGAALSASPPPSSANDRNRLAYQRLTRRCSGRFQHCGAVPRPLLDCNVSRDFQLGSHLTCRKPPTSVNDDFCGPYSVRVLLPAT
jgi:hypothetical protein